ncbi:MAG: DUF58 domain-containing protein [Propioniciclava sp.]
MIRRADRAPARAVDGPRPDAVAPAQRGVATVGSRISDLAVRVVDSAAGRTIARWWDEVVEVSRPVVQVILGVLGWVSPLGWLVAVIALAALGAGWTLGWQEFRIVGLSLGLLCLASVGFTVGRAQLAVSFDLDPARLTAGESAAGQLAVRNAGTGSLAPVGLEIPVGASVAAFTWPVLRANAEVSELVVIPTIHRGVITVGPVRTQRGDPFGLVRREIVWTDPTELFVHPLTVPLGSLGAGLLRDLEGQTTNDVSMSDLAFHTLREYVPGDDRRYIHWRSSAKLSGANGQSQFLVRQFLDTRRTHIAVVVDTDQTSYGDPDEFELALSAGASVTLRALADEMDTTIVCGKHAAVGPAPHLALDTYSRAEFGPHTLQEATGRLNTLAPDVSVVVLVTGPATGFETFRRARAYLAPEVRMVVLQVGEHAELSLRQAAGITVMTLGSLAELPLLLRGGVTR